MEQICDLKLKKCGKKQVRFLKTVFVVLICGFVAHPLLSSGAHTANDRDIVAIKQILNALKERSDFEPLSRRLEQALATPNAPESEAQKKYQLWGDLRKDASLYIKKMQEKGFERRHSAMRILLKLDRLCAQEQKKIPHKQWLTTGRKVALGLGSLISLAGIFCLLFGKPSGAANPGAGVNPIAASDPATEADRVTGVNPITVRDADGGVNPIAAGDLVRATNFQAFVDNSIDQPQPADEQAESAADRHITTRRLAAVKNQIDQIIQAASSLNQAKAEIIQKIKTDDTYCTICFDPFADLNKNQPLEIIKWPCSHFFCYRCASKLLAQPCPLCRQAAIITVDGTTQRLARITIEQNTLISTEPQSNHL